MNDNSSNEMNDILLRTSRHVHSLADKLELAEIIISSSIATQAPLSKSTITSAQHIDFIHQSLVDLSILLEKLSAVHDVRDIETSELKMESTKSILNHQNIQQTMSTGHFDLF